MNTAKPGEKSKEEMEAATGAIASGKNGIMKIMFKTLVSG
jgi:hypothetical protein